MDATRSVPEYVYRMLTEVIDAGATTVNIPDTVGYAIPEEFGAVHPRHQGERAEHRQGASSPCTATTTWAWPSPTA